MSIKNLSSLPQSPSGRCLEAWVLFLYQGEAVVLEILCVHREISVKPLVMMMMINDDHDDDDDDDDDGDIYIMMKCLSVTKK